MLDGIISGLHSLRMSAARIPYDNIHHAVREGDATNVQAFLEDGVDINTPNAYGNTPLHIAVKEDKPDLVKFLLERGADKNARDRFNKTPLHEAARFGTQPYLTSLKHLVDAGSDLEIKDPNGDTPLHIALSYCNLETMKYLVSKGADVKTSNLKGETLFHTAASCCHFKTGSTPCIHEFMPYLKEIGADIEACDLKGNTPLVMAVKRGEYEIVNALLDLGANSDEAYEHCKTRQEMYDKAKKFKRFDDPLLNLWDLSNRSNLLLNILSIERSRREAKSSASKPLDEPCSSSPKGKKRL